MINRGHQREPILREGSDRLLFLETVGDPSSPGCQWNVASDDVLPEKAPAHLGTAHVEGGQVRIDPAPGVSAHMHYAETRRGNIAIYVNDRVDNLGPEQTEFRMPEVASSYGELQLLLGQLGHSISSAVC